MDVQCATALLNVSLATMDSSTYKVLKVPKLKKNKMFALNHAQQEPLLMTMVTVRNVQLDALHAKVTMFAILAMPLLFLKMTSAFVNLVMTSQLDQTPIIFKSIYSMPIGNLTQQTSLLERDSTAQIFSILTIAPVMNSI